MPDRPPRPATRGALLACLALLGVGGAWRRAPDVRAPERCEAPRATVWLDSLPWPIDSAQAVRRALVALRGGNALELPATVARYEASAARVRVTLHFDREPRVVLLCGSGTVAIRPSGAAVIEERVTAR